LAAAMPSSIALDAAAYWLCHQGPAGITPMHLAAVVGNGLAEKVMYRSLPSCVTWLACTSQHGTSPAQLALQTARGASPWSKPATAVQHLTPPVGGRGPWLPMLVTSYGGCMPPLFQPGSRHQTLLGVNHCRRSSSSSNSRDQ
jgi:hypothetical protein